MSIMVRHSATTHSDVLQREGKWTHKLRSTSNDEPRFIVFYTKKISYARTDGKDRGGQLRLRQIS